MFEISFSGSSETNKPIDWTRPPCLRYIFQVVYFSTDAYHIFLGFVQVIRQTQFIKRDVTSCPERAECRRARMFVKSSSSIRGRVGHCRRPLKPFLVGPRETIPRRVNIREVDSQAIFFSRREA
jgi:hypothetical protein